MVSRNISTSNMSAWEGCRILDNRVGEMAVFSRVVEAGSFSEAARLTGMTPSSVSKMIARIEARLGVRLVERSTRHLSLTTEGQFYYERCLEMLSDLDEIEQQIAQGGSEPGGLLRVNASVSFGVRGIEPLLPEFHRAFPKITVDLSLSDEVVDLYLDRTDIAFRVGRLADSKLVARKIGTSRRVIVGSPDYLLRRGIPETPDDLDRHDCLGFNFRRSASVWPRGASGSLLANNGETVGRMALAGVGLARLGDYHVRDYIAQGRLTEVLADSEISDSEEIHAVYRGMQYMPRRMRVFLDHMVPRLQRFLAGPPVTAKPRPVYRLAAM